MPKPAALVLSSGGLHSLITAAIAAREYRVALLHIRDGRTTAKQAGLAFDKQVAHFKPFKSWTVEAPHLRQMALPAENTAGASATGSDATAGLIPLRELQFFAMAAGFAKQIHASVIMWGVHFEQKQADAVGHNIEFVQLANALLELLSPDVAITLKTPLMGLEDQQVIELGYQMGVPFSASWTCQMPIDFPCMSCAACARRIRGFRAAQLPDPIMGKPKQP